MKIRTFPIILMTIISVWSCDQDIDKNEAQIDFYWDQTKCSDPWGTGENDSNLETEAALMGYLKNEGIGVIDIEFNNNSELDPGCESCGCGTGQRIIISVNEEDESKMVELKFIRL